MFYGILNFNKHYSKKTSIQPLQTHYIYIYIFRHRESVNPPLILASIVQMQLSELTRFNFNLTASCP